MKYASENTVESIMEALQGMSERKESIGPEMWMEAASKLNVLLQNEQDLLIELGSELAKRKSFYITEGKSVAYAKTMIEAMDEYKVWCKQKALIERVIETIRLAKKYATLEGDMRRGMINS